MPLTTPVESGLLYPNGEPTAKPDWPSRRQRSKPLLPDESKEAAFWKRTRGVRCPLEAGNRGPKGQGILAGFGAHSAALTVGASEVRSCAVVCPRSPFSRYV